MIFDREIWLFGSLIGIMNGVLFSYYAEAPFLFISHLGFEPGEYGFLGICIALASFTGAWLCKKLSGRYNYKQIITLGYSVMILGEVLFLLAICFISSPVFLVMGIITGVFSIMCGLGIALRHCLSRALNNYREALGTAGALLGFYYYLLVGLITWEGQ